MPQFFLLNTDAPLTTDTTVSLDQERAHYIKRVMRVKPGETLVVGNGQGDRYLAELYAPRAKTVALRLQRHIDHQPARVHRLAIGISLIKGAAMDRALQQAVELGATDIYLINAKRSQLPSEANRLKNKLDHWRKVIIAGCEQCGQLYTPQLHEPNDLSQLTFAGDIVLFHTQGTELPNSLPATHRLLLIGPEGGWEEAEVNYAVSQGWPVVQLQGLVLRAETMPSVALALVQRAEQQSLPS